MAQRYSYLLWDDGYLDTPVYTRRTVSIAARAGVRLSPCPFPLPDSGFWDDARVTGASRVVTYPKLYYGFGDTPKEEFKFVARKKARKVESFELPACFAIKSHSLEFAQSRKSCQLDNRTAAPARPLPRRRRSNMLTSALRKKFQVAISEGRARRYEVLYTIFDGLACQSGGAISSGLEKVYGLMEVTRGVKLTFGGKRAIVEAAQRRAALEKEKKKYKNIEKETRQRAVKKARDTKAREKIAMLHTQGGALLKGAAVAGACWFFNKIQRAIENAGRTAQRNINQVGHYASEFLSGCTEAIKYLKKKLGHVLWSIPFIIALYYIFKMSSVAGIAAVGALFPLLKGQLGDLWQLVCGFFGHRDLQGEIELQSQSGFSQPISKLLAVLLAFSVFKGRRTSSTVSEFMKRVVHVERASDGLQAVLEWAMKALESTINFCMKWAGRDNRVKFGKNNAAYDDWVRKVDAMACSYATSDRDVDIKVINEMVSLVSTGYGFRELYRGTGAPERMVMEQLVRMTNILQPYLGARQSRNNVRMEPVACVLRGRPGVGKTLVAVPFCASVLVRGGLVEQGSSADDVMGNIFQKGNSEYWNGYAGQKVIVYDDLFQLKPKQGEKDCEYMDIIRMIGSWSFPLNFADLSSKGRIFFCSQFVFGTTNVDCIRSEASGLINDHTAVVRRLANTYDIDVQPEYLDDKRELDYSKFLRERAICSDKVGIDRFPWHIWTAQKYDLGTGMYTGVRVPLRDVLSEIIDEMRNRSVTYTSDFKKTVDYIQKLGEEEKEKTSVLEKKKLEVSVEDEDYIAGISVRPIDESVVLSTQGGALFKGTDPSVFDDDSANLPSKETNMKQWWANELAFSRSFWPFMKQIAKFMVIFTGLVVLSVFVSFVADMVGSLIKILLGLFTDGKEKKEKNKKGEHDRVPNDMVRASRVRGPIPAISSQSGGGFNADVVYSNTYKVFAIKADSDVLAFGHLQFLVDRLAAFPHHFVTDMHDALNSGALSRSSQLYFRNAVNPKLSVNITLDRFLSSRMRKDPDTDLTFIKMPELRAHRNIINSYVTEKDLRFVSGRDATLHSCDISEKGALSPNNSTRIRNVGECFFYRQPVTTTEGSVMSRCLYYRAYTEVGECGAPVYLENSASFQGRAVLGMHTAGNASRADPHGASVIITQEMIRSAQSHFDIPEDKFVEDLVRDGVVQLHSQGGLSGVGMTGTFLPIAVVTPQCATSVNPKSSYYPLREFHDMYGEYNYRPAPMRAVYRDGLLIEPMNNAVAPYATAIYHYEQPWLPQCMHVAMQPHMVTTQHDPRLIFTFEEAVKGVVEAEKFRSLPRDTSPGYPFVLFTREGKKEFFGFDKDYDLSGDLCKSLERRVYYIIEQARSNVRLGHVYNDFLKDELRSQAKVDAVATRLISSAPLDYTIAWRMYFGAFAAATMRRNTICGMAPGISCFSDWNKAAQMLTIKGDKVFDGDFKAFDSSEQCCVLDLILDYVNDWYNDGEENQRVRRILWLDLVHSRHIGGAGTTHYDIYQWNKSLPSGHPFTTICNSMYALFMVVAAYISCTGDTTGFWKRCSALTYGDDNVVNPSDEVADKFNQVTVARALEREFGLVYTPGRKDGQWVPTTTLDNATFLKRGFKRDGNGWIAPLELDSFLYTVYWCKNKKEEKEIINANLQNTLMELSYHDDELWDKYAPVTYNRLLGRGVAPVCALDKKAHLAVMKLRSDSWY